MPNLSPHTGAHPDVAENCNRAQLQQQNFFERAGHRIGHVGDPEIVGVARTTVHGAQGADRADAELVDRLQRELLGAVEHLGVQQ